MKGKPSRTNVRVNEDVEREEGDGWAYRVKMQGISFEEFLAQTHFRWISWNLITGKSYGADRSLTDPIPPIELPLSCHHFLLSMYSERGRSSWRSRRTLRDLLGTKGR
jgi:hypothetical protein